MSSVVSPSLRKPFLAALANAMAVRDLATWEHAERVRRYALALARQARIVDEPGPLTPDEYDRVKQHAVIGADLLAEVAVPGPLASLVRHHHENWDGSG